MQCLKNFKNILRPAARYTSRLYFRHYRGNPDDECNVEEKIPRDCYPQQPNLESAREPAINNNCQIATSGDMNEDKCNKIQDKYFFYDCLVQTVVSHIKTQPSNKEYFTPKGLLHKEEMNKYKT